MKRTLFLSMLLFLILTILNILGCRQDQKPNILWILIEDWSPDLSCYGTKALHTPFVDELAEQGVRYDLAFTTSPVCSTSRSAIQISTAFAKPTISATGSVPERRPPSCPPPNTSGRIRIRGRRWPT